MINSGRPNVKSRCNRAGFAVSLAVIFVSLHDADGPLVIIYRGFIKFHRPSRKLNENVIDDNGRDCMENKRMLLVASDAKTGLDIDRNGRRIDYQSRWTAAHDIFPGGCGSNVNPI